MSERTKAQLLAENTRLRAEVERLDRIVNPPPPEPPEEPAPKPRSCASSPWPHARPAACSESKRPAARAYDRPADLERVASSFALRAAEVRCPSTDEWIRDPIWGTGPNPSRAWGYTDMVGEYIVLHPALCAGGKP
jgi:hypothetical protein